MAMDSSRLVDQIKNKESRIGIVGLGYVGLPLLLEFASSGFPITGFDIDPRKISQLKQGESYIHHIQPEKISRLIAANPLAQVISDFSSITTCDIIIICVPTPLNEYREPDLSFITQTGGSIAPYIRIGQLVILESTTYPGTTEEVLAPILGEGSGLIPGIDFLIAYSPEREDPNNKEFSTKTIPKVVGGINPESLNVAQVLYNTIICQTVPVSSCRAAEATKLMENIFRCVNIALVNELKIVFDKMNLDVWEIIEAAKTKPFGYMPFYPGPGLGGHCIPIDPFYLSWKAKEYGISTRFIELAGEINTNMPSYVIQKTMLALNDRKKSLKGSRILLVGLAYKKNVDDERESPTFILWKELNNKGAQVDYLDPYCLVVKHTREHPQFAGIKSIAMTDIESNHYDAAIIATAHDGIDYDAIVRYAEVVIDTRNCCPTLANVYRA